MDTSNVTEAQVSDAIKTIATDALPAAKIIPQNIWGMDEGGFGRLIVAPEVLKGTDNKIHAFAFWRQSTAESDNAISGLRTGVASYSINRPKPNPQLLVETWRYEFRFMFAYASGSNTSNSTRDFNAKIDGITRAFAVKPNLGLSSVHLEGVSQVTWQSLSVVSNNDFKAHDGVGVFRVTVHQPITPN